MNIDANYYKILGVLDDAEDIAIRAVYRALAQTYHPDKFQGDPNFAEERMKEINEAYSILSDPASRREYDEIRSKYKAQEGYEESPGESESNFEGKYRLRCKSCSEDVLISNWKCKKCSTNLAYIEKEGLELSPSYICQFCSSHQNAVLLPDSCPSCGEFNNEWIHLDEKKWFQPDLSVRGSNPSPMWISGDFDGTYVGSLASNNPYRLDSKEKSYPIHISKGQLKNVVLVDAPPKAIGKKEVRPIRQQDVDATIYDSESKKFVPMELHDFRLHDYQDIASESFYDSRVIEGRISGKAYSFIDPHDPKNINKQKPSAGGIEKTPGDAGGIGLPGQTQTQLLDPKRCFFCSPWLSFLLPLIIWFICTWKVALFSIVIHKLFCWLNDFFTRKDLRIKSKNLRIIFAILLILISLISLVILNHFYFVYGCGSIPWWLLLPSLLALFSSTWLIHCFPKAVLLLFWYAALSFWCIGKGGQCFLNNMHSSQSILNYSHSASHGQATQDTQQATHVITSPDSSSRVSVQDVVENPLLLKDCSNSIYFPNAVIFDFDSDVILPTAEENLLAIVKVLENAPDSKFIITGHTDSKGDTSNDGYMHNLDLSERRAGSVVSWFQSHGKFKEDQFEARGAGSKFPLTMVIDRLSINRRVEIRIKCNESK
jgi:outer membrane protein OmpA-like peptidoglycan-associated protein